MPPASVSRRRALMAAAALLGAGCSQPAPVKSTFLLEPARGVPAAAVTRRATLKVDPVSVAGPFRGRSLVYRESELKYEADFYNEFLIAPGAMIGEKIASWLAEAGLYQAVLPPDGAFDADQHLEAFVSELYGDFRDPAHPAAVVTIKFFLTDAKAAEGVFAWTAELRGRRDIPSRSAEALVAGLNAAFGDVLQQLATALGALPTR
jgi:cholesterol transport system auxiliary component